MSAPKEFAWPTDGADFQGADLSGYAFRDLKIEASQTSPVSFHRADMRGTHFRRTRLIGVDLSRGDFLDSILEESTFERCKLDHFGMQSTTLHDSRILECDGPAAEFSDSRFVRSILAGGSFTGGTILGCVFEECEIVGVGLERMTIENNHFYRTKFKDLDLGNQSVLHCTFSACKFEHVTLDVDILSTCSGFSMEDIRHLGLSRRGLRLQEPVEAVVDALYQRHSSRGEVVEACTLAVLARREDWFEESIQRLDDLLAAASGAKTLHLVRLARKLLYWHAEGMIDPYWVAWACNAIVDRVRDPHSPLPPDHHIIEAVTLLMPVAEQYARTIVLAAAPSIGGRHLLDPVRVEVTVDGQWTTEDALRLLADLNEHASHRVPRVLQVPNGIMRFELARARAGSIVLEGTMLLAGLAFLKIFLQQSRAVADEAGRLFASIGNAATNWHEMRDRIKGTDDDEPGAAPIPPGMPPTPGGSAGALAELPTSKGVEAAAAQEFLVNVVTRTVVPPKHRRTMAKHVIRVEIATSRVTADERGPRP